MVDASIFDEHIARAKKMYYRFRAEGNEEMMRIAARDIQTLTIEKEKLACHD
jgi:hypothetical protein